MKPLLEKCTELLVWLCMCRKNEDPLIKPFLHSASGGANLTRNLFRSNKIFMLMPMC